MALVIVGAHYGTTTLISYWISDDNKFVLIFTEAEAQSAEPSHIAAQEGVGGGE